MSRHSERRFDLQGWFARQRADYDAAKSNKWRRTRTGIPAAGAGADYHIRSDADYLRIMEYARDMDRNDVVIGQAVDRVCANVLQDGFSLDPQTGDQEIDRHLVDRWNAWADTPSACDVSARYAFKDLERLAFRACVVDGDALLLPLQSGHLELIEAHRVRTPSNTRRNVVHGVLMDQYRKPLEYWITKDDINAWQAVRMVGETIQWPAWDDDGFPAAFHVADPKRWSQTRGITAFARCFSSATMFEDINFARMVQQQAVSCWVMARTLPAEVDPLDAAVYGESETETTSSGTSRMIDQIGPGIEVAGEPGEDFKFFTPNVPPEGYFQHVKMILTLISINLDLPVAVLLLDPSETNFSGWRGAIDQARMGLKHHQQWLKRRFHGPCYVWKVRQWLVEDRDLRAMAAANPLANVFAHQWHAPRWPYIQPLEDAGADLLRMRNALSSPRRILAERGGNADWSVLVGEIVEDNATAIRRAKQEAALINGEFSDGEPVHWRELISLPTPDGVTVALGNEQGTTDNGQRGNDADR